MFYSNNVNVLQNVNFTIENMKKIYIHSFAIFFLVFMAQFTLSGQAFDECDSPFDVPDDNFWCSRDGQFSNQQATTSTYGPPSCWNSVGNDIWFRFGATATDVWITVRGNTAQGPGGTLSNPGVALYSDDCGGTISELACTANSAASNNAISMYKGGLIPGTYYLIRVTGLGGTRGTFKLCVEKFNPPIEPTSDCPTGSILCDKSPFIVRSVTGAGNNINELDDATCFNNGAPGNNESNSTWFKWKCETAGTLTFILNPLSADDDLDFVLYELPNGLTNCSDKKLLRCMASGDFNFPSPCMGPTGLRTGETDTEEDAGCSRPGKNNWLAPLFMEKDKVYALVVNNFTSTGNGFGIEFDGTGEFEGPKPLFETDPRNICYGDQVTFIDRSTFSLGVITQWNWIFGSDATPSFRSGQGPFTVRYDEPGEKIVLLTVTSDKGCKVTKTTKVFVDSCCQTRNRIDVNPIVSNLVCPGSLDGAIQTNASSNSQPFSYRWNIGANTPSIQGASEGAYRVTITNPATCVRILDLAITGPPPFQADTNIIKPTCNGGRDGVLTLGITGGTPSYTYNFNNQGFTPTNRFPNLAIGDYPVTVRDSRGCLSFYRIPVRELELLLNPSIRASIPPSCHNLSDGKIELDVINGLPPLQFDWNDGLGFVSQNTRNVAGGVYNIIVRDANLCRGNYTFSITPPPPLTIAIRQQLISCDGLADGVATPLVSGGTPVYRFRWTGNRTDSVIRNLPAGNYTLTVTDNNNCVDSMTTSFASPSPLFLDILNTEDPICWGDSTGVIEALARGGRPGYRYGAGDIGPQVSGNFNFLGAGKYLVYVEDTAGCRKEIDIEIVDPERIKVDAGPDRIVDLGYSTDLEATVVPSSSGLVYLWTPPNFLSCTDCPDPKSTPIRTTTYRVGVVDAAGCSGFDDVRVIVNKKRSIFFPTAFSPNADTNNDLFRPYGDRDVKNISLLQVFDRWGNKVYEGKDLPINQPAFGWDGTFRGKECDTGVFAVLANIEFIDGETVTYSGDVSLLR
jgi:gliding motility-associated-like protein